jgi:hypothetical protein
MSDNVQDAPRSTSARPGGLVSCSLSRFRLELPRRARLHMMAATAKLAQDAGFLHLALESLQDPIDSIGFR